MAVVVVVVVGQAWWEKLAGPGRILWFEEGKGSWPAGKALTLVTITICTHCLLKQSNATNVDATMKST